MLSGFWGDAYKKLDDLWKNHRIKSGDLNTAPDNRITLGLYAKGTITLDTIYGILDQSVGGTTSRYHLSTSEARAATLLHEVGHATLFLPAFRHRTDAQSDTYNQQIVNACFK